MDFLLWFTVGFFFIGFAGLIFIKRKIKTVQSIIWWIMGTTAWGIASIFLVVWSFHTIF
ncbi:hypothetical protein [Bacillus sp. Marseille-Q1617]|uniref:hypothetical protein n=1 Tax=Bacillus sp. Marseille-Q1617 TaxID=2736887 RepID=UPI00158EDF8F|nr:hypothetical protein [Bacillus sp. Marseille-Q1617]